MKTIFQLSLLLTIMLASPAHADMFEETEESYYTRQMRSCLYKKERTSVFDLFRATRPVYMDDCCAQSVYAMQKADAKWIHPDKDCPEGKVKTRLQCETSKDWCMSVGNGATPSRQNAPKGD